MVPGLTWRVSWDDVKMRGFPGVICVNARRASVAACFVALLVRGTAQAQGVPERLGKWWQQPEIRRDLGLTARQIDSLENTFQRKLGERIERRRKLDGMDAALTRLIEKGEADDATVVRLSSEAERIRAERNVSRTLMLIQMYRILTPGQRLKLTEVHKGHARHSLP